MTRHAYFVDRPRIIDDLCQPHHIEAELPYEVVKTVTLVGIEYENFITVMVADRQFLEDNAHLCSKNGAVFRCLLVKRRKAEDGFLVVPDGAWVDIAALLS